MRGGHLLSKMRFVSAQLLAYLEEGLWLKLASHANLAAKWLRDGLVDLRGVKVIYKVEGNAVFACLPERMLKGLLAEGYLFHRWPGEQGLVRFMCSYSLQKKEIDEFVRAARLLA